MNQLARPLMSRLGARPMLQPTLRPSGEHNRSSIHIANAGRNGAPSTLCGYLIDCVEYKEKDGVVYVLDARTSEVEK